MAKLEVDLKVVLRLLKKPLDKVAIEEAKEYGVVALDIGDELKVNFDNTPGGFSNSVILKRESGDRLLLRFYPNDLKEELIE